MPRRTAIAATSVLATALSFAGDSQVDQLTPLFERARLYGEARGILGGPAAERMRAMGMTQPVEIFVQRLNRLSDPGCARIRTTFTQTGVTPPGETSPRDRVNWFEINWCEGGRLPRLDQGQGGGG